MPLLSKRVPFPFLKTILQFFRLHFYPPQTCIAANWLVSVTVIGTLWNPIKLAIVETSVFLFASISLYKSHSPSLTLLVLIASRVFCVRKKKKLILNLRNQRFLLNEFVIHWFLLKFHTRLGKFECCYAVFAHDCQFQHWQRNLGEI